VKRGRGSTANIARWSLNILSDVPRASPSSFEIRLKSPTDGAHSEEIFGGGRTPLASAVGFYELSVAGGLFLFHGDDRAAGFIFVSSP